MANYIAYSRSNYFKVKDEGKFRSWIEDYDAEVITDDGNDELRFGFISVDDDGVIPRNYDECTGDETLITEDISKYLADGETVIIQEVGYEGMRCLFGYAIAIHSNGEAIELNLHQIHDMAKDKFGGKVTECGS